MVSFDDAALVQAHEELKARHATIEGPAHSAVDRVAAALSSALNRPLEAFTTFCEPRLAASTTHRSDSPLRRGGSVRSQAPDAARFGTGHHGVPRRVESRGRVGLRTEHQQSVTPEGNEDEVELATS